MEDEGWIDVKQRKPTDSDADVFHCVLAYHMYNGAMVTGWHQFDINPYFTHWMPLPLPPACHRDRHGLTNKK